LEIKKKSFIFLYVTAKREKDIVLAAMAHIEQVSCVRFLAYDWGADMGQLDYFKVLKSQGGCFAYVGRQKDTVWEVVEFLLIAIFLSFETVETFECVLK